MSVHPATIRQLFGIAVFVLMVIVLYIVFPPAMIFVTINNLTLDPSLAIPFFLGLYLIRSFLAWPVAAISIVLGFVYGPIAIPLALVGTVLTTIPLYLLARYLQHEAGFLARVGEVITIVRRTSGDIQGVAAIRLAPLPIDAVSYAFGLARIPLRPYLIGTTIGEIPWVVAAVMIGTSTSHLTTTGLTLNPLLFITLFALAALLLLTRPAYRRVNRRRIKCASSDCAVIQSAQKPDRGP